MSLPQKEIAIGDKSFRLTALAVKDARPLQFALAKVLAPVIASTVTGEPAAIASGLSKMIETLDLETYENVCRVLLRNTEHLDASGTYRLDVPAAQDRAFACAYDVMLQVLAAGLEFNFATFLKGLGITGLPSQT